MDPDMNKDYISKLTIGLYRVTNVFPQHEPLRNKIREVANDVYHQVLTQDRVKSEDILSNINVLNAFLELAMCSKWTADENVQVLIRHYLLLGDKIKIKQIEDTKKSKPAALPKKIYIPVPTKKITKEKTGGNALRRADIQKILSQEGPKRLVQILQSFPQINKRTLRRDLTAMVEKGVLERYDVGKLTFYKIKSV